MVVGCFDRVTGGRGESVDRLDPTDHTSLTGSKREFAVRVSMVCTPVVSSDITFSMGKVLN